MWNFRYIACLVIALQLLSAPNSDGWGSGHDGVAELIVVNLPKDIREFFGKDALKKIQEWSHANDNFDPWDKVQKQYFKFSKAEMDLLEEHGLTSMFSFHAPKGQAVSLMLLTQAFRDKNPEHAAFWLTALGHSIGDEAACNHGPLIHYMTYYLRGGYGLRMGDGIGTDFHHVYKTKSGKAIAVELLTGFHPKKTGETSDEILIRIMLSGMEGNAYMTRRERAVAATYARHTTAEIQKEGRIALTEMGVYAVKHSLDAVVTAWSFAQGDGKLSLTKELLQKQREKVKVLSAKRPLADDSIYSDLLEIPTESRRPYVGFLLEPSISMNHACFSFLSKVLLSASMRSMRKASRAFRALDYREFTGKALPEPDTMPVLVLCARSTPGELKKSIMQYTSAGGRILWIGKNEVKELGPLSKAMQKMIPAEMPVSAKYGSHGSEKVGKVSITFNGEFAQVMGTKAYRFAQNPNTNAGWMKPSCDVKFEPLNDRVKILAKVAIEEDSFNVAAIGLDEKGQRQFIFLPEYLMSPFLFSERKELDDPSKMTLDEFTEKLFFASLELLQDSE